MAMQAIAHPTRWRRRKQARPSEILEAALAVFAEKGLEGARMEDIARRAGVTKGTIYLYFESKDAVFKALLAESIGERVHASAALIENFEGSSGELLGRVLRLLGAFVAHSDRVVLPKIVIAEIGKFPELARFYREEVIGRGLALWETILKRGVARGEFRGLPPEHMARICIAPILLAAIWRTSFARFDSEPYDIEGLIETHIGVLLRGLAIDGGAP
jgi:AcrR family transcriptional regulator